MNIAVFAKRTTIHNGHGGLETQNKALVEGLVKKGHSVTLFSPKWEIVNDIAIENNVNYVFVDCVYRMGPVFGFFGTLQKNNWINRSVEEFTKIHSKQKFDVALGQSSTALGVIKRKAELGIKIISVSHGTIIGEYKSFLAGMELPKDVVSFVKNTGFTLKNFFRRQRDFVHGSDKVICVSNYVKKALIEETFAEDAKFVVIHNGIEPELFKNLNTNTRRGAKGLFVGRIIKDKGVDVLVEMFKDKSFEGYSIDIVGDGEYFIELRQLINNTRNLKDRVNLVGKIQYDDVLNNYFMNKEYGVFLLPTERVEGFPMVLVEALFSGLPIVAYDIGGVSDAVENEKTGYLVKLNDLETFKEKVLNVIKDTNLKNKLSQNCLQKAKNEFTLEIMINSYEKIIKEVLA